MAVHCLTEGTIRYTTDGSEPTAASLVYATPFVLNDTTTILARSFRPEMKDSPVIRAAFTVAP